MLDKFERRIEYMRISLISKCNLRCLYCRPQNLAASARVLEYEEILRVARCALALGITAFKITGGEPLLREGAAAFIARLRALPGVRAVTLTTNGTFLEKKLPDLLRAGLDGINISLDTLDENFYRQLTGGELAPVLRAIAAACKCGVPCKLNCVPLQKICTQDNAINSTAGILALARYAAQRKIPLRFIELMPLACNEGLAAYSGEEVREILRSAGYALEILRGEENFFAEKKIAGAREEDPAAQKINGAPANSTKATLKKWGNGPAVYYRARREGEESIIGFIEALGHKFCADCNRVRLTSAGLFKPCLYAPAALDVGALLHGGASDAAITRALRAAIYEKPAAHAFASAPPGFSMSEVGG